MTTSGTPGDGTGVLSAIVDGTEYSLDDGVLSYWTADDGLGMSPMHRITERGPLQHGNTDRGYRLDPRNLRLIFDIIADTQTAWESGRNSIMSIFQPGNAAITLKFAYETRTYYLDCHYIGQMSLPSADRIGWNQIVIADLVANDPTFYGDSKSISFALGSGGTGTMLVPTVIPMTVGTTTLNTYRAVNYYGTFLTYPIIRITGPITNCVITNTGTDEKLDFTGTTIAAGTYYEIDCRYGYKTVVNNAGTSVIANLTNDSDLATFHIGTKDEVGGVGDPSGAAANSFHITGTSISGATKIEMQYYERFVGI